MRVKPMKDKLSFWLVFVFALCLMVFGFMGYHKTGSLMSLYSGCTFGLLLLLSCLGMYLKKRWGLFTAPILTALLTAMFAYRTIVTGKMVPIILMIVSFFVFCVLMSRSKRKIKPQR